VNIPNGSYKQHVQRPYTPDEFKDKLIRRIDASEPLKQLATGQVPGGSRNDWRPAIKKIMGKASKKLRSTVLYPICGGQR
jgi:hypothetical protein